eukprot:Opistho-2@19811
MFVCVCIYVFIVILVPRHCFSYRLYYNCLSPRSRAIQYAHTRTHTRTYMHTHTHTHRTRINFGRLSGSIVCGSIGAAVGTLVKPGTGTFIGALIGDTLLYLF